MDVFCKFYQSRDENKYNRKIKSFGRSNKSNFSPKKKYVKLIYFTPQKMEGRQNKTSSPNGNDRLPESIVPRSNAVFSAIKANLSKVNSPETLFPHYKSRGAFSTSCYQ